MEALCLDHSWALPCASFPLVDFNVCSCPVMNCSNEFSCFQLSSVSFTSELLKLKIVWGIP